MVSRILFTLSENEVKEAFADFLQKNGHSARADQLVSADDSNFEFDEVTFVQEVDSSSTDYGLAKGKCQG